MKLNERGPANATTIAIATATSWSAFAAAAASSSYAVQPTETGLSSSSVSETDTEKICSVCSAIEWGATTVTLSIATASASSLCSTSTSTSSSGGKEEKEESGTTTTWGTTWSSSYEPATWGSVETGGTSFSTSNKSIPNERNNFKQEVKLFSPLRDVRRRTEEELSGLNDHPGFGPR